jgi:ketosteroid isomerase-like protein
MKVRNWLCRLGLVAIAGCAAPPPPEEPSVDLEAERSALMDADRAWSESVGSVDEFMSFLADDATVLPDAAPMVRGESIRNMFEGMLSTPGLTVHWEATGAEVSESGDLGYTIGTTQVTVDQEGTPMVTVGKYVTVWKKQADGSWKVVVDCFNADGPPTQG